MPQLRINCLRLAGRALVPREEGSEENVAIDPGGKSGLVLTRLPAIQV